MVENEERPVVSVREHMDVHALKPTTEKARRLTGLLAGARERIRTPDTQIRSLVLYPAELRALYSVVQSLTYTILAHSARGKHNR